MNKNIVPLGGSILPGSATFIKENKENNIHIVNSDVTLNVTVQQSQVTETIVEQLPATQRFSREYYQLLVTYDKNVFENNIITFQPDRVLDRKNVPDEIFERCHTLEKTGIDELKTFPAIVCIENSDFGGRVASPQTAWFSQIKAIQKIHGKIKVAFEPIASFDQSVLCNKRNAVFFDLDMDNPMTTLNRTDWSVHKTDLFEAFREAGIDIIPT